MNYILPITDLRKNIFSIMDRVVKTGEVIEVEKEGKRIVKIVPIKDDPAQKADYLLTHVLPKLAGIWKDMPKSELAKIRSIRRGAREKSYWNRKIFS